MPLSIETGGFCDKATTGFFKAFVKYSLATGNSMQPNEWTSSLRAAYSYRLQSIRAAVSIAVARSVANTLLGAKSVLAPAPTGPGGGW